MVRLVRLERTLYGLSDRASANWGTDAHVANPGGFEPLADGLKVRSLSIRVEGSGSSGGMIAA